MDKLENKLNGLTLLDVETFAGVLQERAAEINPKKINIEAKNPNYIADRVFSNSLAKFSMSMNVYISRIIENNGLKNKTNDAALEFFKKTREDASFFLKIVSVLVKQFPNKENLSEELRPFIENYISETYKAIKDYQKRKEEILKEVA